MLDVDRVLGLCDRLPLAYIASFPQYNAYTPCFAHWSTTGIR